MAWAERRVGAGARPSAGERRGLRHEAGRARALAGEWEGAGHCGLVERPRKGNAGAGRAVVWAVRGEDWAGVGRDRAARGLIWAGIWD